MAGVSSDPMVTCVADVATHDMARPEGAGRALAAHEIRSRAGMSGPARRGGWLDGADSGLETDRGLAVVKAVLAMGSEKAAAHRLGLSHSNTAVLCRACNSTKGASIDRDEVGQGATETRPDRASQLCAGGRVSPVLGDRRQRGAARALTPSRRWPRLRRWPSARASHHCATARPAAPSSRTSGDMRMPVDVRIGGGS